jgi:DNA repair protein RadC
MNNRRLKQELQNAYLIPEYKITCSMKVKQSELFPVSSSKDCYKYLQNCYEPETISYKEYFYVLFLNRANKVTGYAKIGEGGITGTVADPRIVLQMALMAGAASLVLCHNHPSGNLKPSRQDEELTQKIKCAANYLDIKVLDHVIITEDAYYSFADEGIL